MAVIRPSNLIYRLEYQMNDSRFLKVCARMEGNFTSLFIAEQDEQIRGPGHDVTLWKGRPYFYIVGIYANYYPDIAAIGAGFDIMLRGADKDHDFEDMWMHNVNSLFGSRSYKVIIASLILFISHSLYPSFNLDRVIHKNLLEIDDGEQTVQDSS